MEADLGDDAEGEAGPLSTPTKKGRVLEDAVRAIEHAILTEAPGLAESTFTIQTRRVVSVDGVRHEIDVWVEIDAGNEYSSVFIFECKNWEAPVGKNELIVFSEKIAAVRAQCGFFVAKAFTKDAEAQSRKDKRVRLLTAQELPTDPSLLPADFHVLSHEHTHVQLELYGVDHGDAAVRKPVDVRSTQATLNGDPVSLNEHFEPWIKSLTDEEINRFDSASATEGPYDLTARSERTCGGELVVDGNPIGSVTVTATISVRVIRPPVVSHFDVSSRGRVMMMAPTRVGKAGQIQFAFIARPRD